MLNEKRSLSDMPDTGNHFAFLSQWEYEFYEERAAILEFEAGLSKAEAEQQAWQCVLSLRQEQVLPKAG